jgi:iron complex outermembrane receptor protein
VQLRGLYEDAVPATDAGTARAAPYFLADARTGLERIRAGALRLAPFIDVANLLDRRYVSAVEVDAFGGRYFEPGPGRSWTVGLGVTWER